MFKNTQRHIADFNFGGQTEQQVKEILEDYFNIPLKKLGQMSIFDFTDVKSHTNFFELKARRNTHNQYPTTIVGYNKIEFIQQRPENAYYFVFRFLDGLYYIKYSKELFDTFKVGEAGRCDRGSLEYKQHIFIPYKHLTLIALDKEYAKQLDDFLEEE